MKKEFVIFCDESEQKGKRLSNFYGGAIIQLKDMEKINDALNNLKNELSLNEIKRQRVTLQFLDKYKLFIKLFFGFVKTGKIKVRIIFSRTSDLNKENDKKERYSKFYYLFIKHAFGLSILKQKAKLRLYFDQLPNNEADNLEFKKHIWGLQFTKLLKGKVKILKEDIVDINSKNHPIVQAVDLVTGIMEFYANEFDNGIELGNRGVAKIELYKYIMELVDEINPNYFIAENYFEYFDQKIAYKSKYLHCQFKLKK